MISHSFRASKTFTTFVVAFAAFTDVLLQNLVVLVLPYALNTQIGLQDDANIQGWTSILLSAFAAALMFGSLLFGYVGDKLSSRRTPFVLGLVFLFLSTFAFAFATNVWTLLIARLLEGLSASIVSTTGFTLVLDVVGQKHLGRALGFVSMATSFGMLAGPAIGGVLYEYYGYFQVYLPAFGLIAMEILLRMLIVDKRQTSHQSSSSSPPPSPTLVPSSLPPTEPASLEEGTGELEPLLHPDSNDNNVHAYRRLLTSPRFLVALTGLFVLTSIAFGFDSTLTPFVRDSFSMRAIYAAALFLALAVPMVLAPLSGWVTDRLGPKVPAGAGLLLATSSLMLLSFVSKKTHSPFAKLLVGFMSLGLGFASSLTPLRVEASLVVNSMETAEPGCFGANGGNGRAFALVNTVFAAGGLTGPLYAGFLRVNVGWEILQWINGALCFGLLMLVLIITSRRID